MITKVLEIRDRGTCILALAVNMNPTEALERAFLRRCGYPCDGKPNIGLTHLSANGTAFWNDPYGWHGARTWGVAHNWIIDHWEDLSDGDVVDVEFILGETQTKKASEVLP